MKKKVYCSDYKHIGQRFKVLNGVFKGDVYLLAKTGGISCSLVDVESGQIWTDPVSVHSFSKITKTEFKKICGNVDFKLIR